ncbi:MAG TPA: pilus assembly protein TadG-related protein, partial [Anaerolineales bacterium]
MTYRRQRTARHCNESGQALVFLVLALSMFLLGAGALCVDMSNLWFHRQAAQNAADAACTAGAMDLLVEAQGGATGHQGFVTGTAFNCTPGSTAAPCRYAAKNGYNSSTGNLVSVSFPASVSGVPTSSLAPSSLIPTAFMGVLVTDNVQTFFSGILSGNRTQAVRAYSACGVVLAKAPIPILVLDPANPPGGNALYVHGTPDIKIKGGPVQSIQVNSNATTAVNLQGGTIDLTKGGPAYSGSDLGVFGGPATAQSGFITAGSGAWRYPKSPISDPYAPIPAPAQPPGPTATAGCTTAQIQAGNCTVAYHDPTHGCPALAGCVLYTAGYYPSDIMVKKKTAIFDPGVYYVNGKLDLQSQSMVRPGTGVGDGSG